MSMEAYILSRNVKNIILFILTASLIAIFATYFGNVLRPTETDINVINIETFHELPKDSVEVVMFGSSRMWRGVNTMEMYDKYGVGAYNYACNWQHINTTSMFVEDAFKTQSPKLVIIDDTNAADPLSGVDMDGEVYYTKAIPWSKTKLKCVRQYFGRNLERYFSYFVPLCAFHENWQNVSIDNFNDKNIRVDFLADDKDADAYEFRRTMGFGDTDIVTKVNIGDWHDFAQAPFEEYATNTLDDIVNMCKANGAMILFVTIPFEGESANIEAMSTYAQANGCDYINLYGFMDEICLDPGSDFGDPSHLNTSGATKVADFLGQYIVEHYELTDYRNIDGNLWAAGEWR